MVVALTRGFYIEHTIKNQTNKYTKEEFLEFIEKQKDVPDLNTDNIWRLFGYAIKEYIYKGKANRKYISKNIFLDRFPEEAINKDKQIKRT